MDKNIWTNEVLEILYECFKNSENQKTLICLVEDKLPKIHPISSLSMIKKLCRVEKKWMQMATRKKNEKEKIKKEKENLKKEKELVREKKRKDREIKKINIEKKEKEKEFREKLRIKIDKIPYEELNSKITPEFFFCPALQQYMPTISCVLRVFGSDAFCHGSDCEKCKYMEKYLNLIRGICNE